MNVRGRESSDVPRTAAANSAGLCGRPNRRLDDGARIAYLGHMSVHVTLPDELAEQIDHIASDRSAFVAEAVRRLLHESAGTSTGNEIARINELADELNREAEDVLEYQVTS